MKPAGKHATVERCGLAAYFCSQDHTETTRACESGKHEMNETSTVRAVKCDTRSSDKGAQPWGRSADGGELGRRFGNAATSFWA